MAIGEHHRPLKGLASRRQLYMAVVVLLGAQGQHGDYYPGFYFSFSLFFFYSGFWGFVFFFFEGKIENFIDHKRVYNLIPDKQ